MSLTRVATCNLAQWALDFEGNGERILESLREAHQKGARYRLGPELEICGYSCEDHFLEMDTFTHSWQTLCSVLERSRLLTRDMLCDFGMPVLHRGVRYNCRVFVLDSKILLIRPKRYLANDGNYRELRFFQAWAAEGLVEPHVLPDFVAAATGQTEVPFGEALLETQDSSLAAESCEELFTPSCPSIQLGLEGVEVIGNGSASHHQLRKLHTRVELIRNASAKSGGLYLYANTQGCDGTRLYFDGGCLIFLNGELLAQGTQFSLGEVEVIVATVDLNDIRSFRGRQQSRGLQASQLKVEARLPRIRVPWRLCSDGVVGGEEPTRPSDVFYHSVEQEIAYGPACWLWDYLRRSNQRGFFLPLSGGADSGATAGIVGCMCQLVMKDIIVGGGGGGGRGTKKKKTLEDLRRIVGDPDFTPATHDEIAGRLFFTCYMGSSNSSAETRRRAEQLAREIGSVHRTVDIDDVGRAFVELFVATADGKRPRFKTAGGSNAENLALQNIQARSRMVIAYLLAQLLPWAVSKAGGSLLVLGSSNVDEALRGYYTKYDCSAADINPIGSISKICLRRFLRWGAVHLGYPTLAEIEDAPPTAELEPITADHVQTDEEDMGMSYEELARFGVLRKIYMCGPLSMFMKLVHEWHHLPPAVVAQKVKDFFHYYAINRHKMTTLTPSYHAEAYSPDDNRHDLRPFLYPRWQLQFREIDKAVKQLEGSTTTQIPHLPAKL